MRFLDTSNWSDYVLKATVNLADKFNEEYSGHHMVSVGQTPAWVLFAQSQLRAQQGQEEDVTFLPFSGRFTERGYGLEHPCYILTENAPEQEKYCEYFNFLSQIGQSPADIARRYEEHGQKTVFVDYLLKGRGFASFLHLFFTALDQSGDAKTKELVSQAAIFHILTSRDSALDTGGKILVHDKGPRYHTAELQHFDLADTLFISNLAGAQGQEAGYVGSDRLVPSYDISKVGRGKLLATDNEQRQALVKSKFENTVQWHLREKNARAAKAAQANSVSPAVAKLG